jgi:hypothetical protein
VYGYFLECLDLSKLSYFYFVALLLSFNAHAHNGFGNISPFWAGVLHFLISPLAIAATVGYFAWIAGSKKVLDFKSIAICSTSAGILSLYPGLLPQHILAGGVLLVGIAAMLRIRTPQLVIQAMGLLIGAVIGIGADLDSQSVISAFGVSVVTLYLGIVFLGLWDRGTEIAWLNPILPTASRVLGSWVAALGLLLVALGIRIHA